ncbi:hypothetical protein PV762_04840 [Mitsuaria sp. CC2]|uniref:hypothetical protein n=1 Tax=Mitsuaria sp. CC2 TaxID=3029186 RepID=UPI003B8DBE4B
MKTSNQVSSDYASIDAFASSASSHAESGRADHSDAAGDYADPWEFKQLDPRAQQALEQRGDLPRGLAALSTGNGRLQRESGVYATVTPSTARLAAEPHGLRRQGAIRREAGGAPKLPARQYRPAEADGAGEE